VDHQIANENQNSTRELRTFSNYCKNYCANYATGTCRATPCLGYRRRSLNKSGNSTKDHAKTCQEGIAATQIQLNELITKNSISDSCKLFINNITRTSTCYDDVVYGEVEGYRVWNLTADSNVTNTSGNGNAYGIRAPSLLFESYTMNTVDGGYAFCQTTVFNIEIMTNACVDHAQITVHGPNQYHFDRKESYSPFTLFTSSTTTDNTDINQKSKILLGQTLPYVGTYNITIVPDGIRTKTKQFDVTILDC
jgi:hypothetical protein